MCKFSRRRGKLCPGAGKTVSRRRGKVIHSAPESSRARFWRGSGGSVGFLGAGGNCVPAPRKLFPGAEKSSHSFTIEEKYIGFPGAGGSCVPAPGKLCPGARGHIRSVSKKNI